MRPLYAIAITTSLLVGGCRTTENLYKATPRTDRVQQDLLGASVPVNLEKRGDAPAPTPKHGDQVRRLPHATAPAVQQVAFNQAPNMLQISEPESVPKPLGAGIMASDLSLSDLESIALRSNPTLAQAAYRVEAAQGNWVQVGLAPNPNIGYSGQQLSSHGQAEQQGVFIGQKFITGKKLRLSRETAAWEVDRAERELEAFRLRVLTDVRIGYYDVLIAQRRRKLATDLVGISEQGEAAAEALFKGDEVSEADPLRARIQADTARILLQNSINQHVESWRQLTAVLGMPELALQHLVGDLKIDNLNLSWPETLRQVLSESPEIAAAMADVEATQWAIERAYAEVIPDIDVKAVIQDDRGTGSSNGNLQVTLPIPFWNRNQGGIRKAQANAAAAEQAVDRLALDLQSRLATAFQRYESARNQVDQYSKKGGILENAQRTLDLIRTGYKADEFAVLDLLNVQRTYFQTNLAYLDSVRELWVSVTEIRGLLLRGSLPR